MSLRAKLVIPERSEGTFQATAKGPFTAMNLDAIAIGHNPPEDVNTVIEVPIGGEPVKYEMDKAAGTLVVDRFLYTPMRYPGITASCPHTLSDDGDPIDVLVANTRPIIPGAVMNVRPIGVLRMEDDGGGDEKIIAVPSSRITQRYVNVEDPADLPRSRATRSSTSSSTTRTSSPASG
jgi:inorganic pyrophosphatase